MILFVQVFASTNLAQSASSIKPGSICKKTGLVTRISGASYICVKTGNKLVWKKQISVVKPSTIATPSPNSTSAEIKPELPASKESAKPSPTAATIVRNNGPQTESGRAATESIYRALNQVATELYKRSLSSGRAEVNVYSDDHSNPLIGSVKDAIVRTTEMMRAIAPNFPNNEVYLFKSFSWFEQSNIKDLCPQVVRNQKQFGWANAGCNKYWVGDLTYYENPSLYKNTKRHSAKTLLSYTGAHETVHLLQSGNMGSYSDKFPAWYREGSANVGAGLVMVTLPEFANGDYAAIDDWEMNSWSKQRCQAVFESWKVKNVAEGHESMNNCEYSVGRRMVEFLVARDNTFDNIRKVYDAVGPNMSFDEAFEKYHGIELSQFYRDVEQWLEKLDWAKAPTY